MAYNPESTASRIAALKVGECHTITERIAAWTRNPEGGAKVTTSRKNLKDRISPSVMRATERSGNTYTCETTVALNNAHTHFLVSATVTRVS